VRDVGGTEGEKRITKAGSGVRWSWETHRDTAAEQGTQPQSEAWEVQNKGRCRGAAAEESTVGCSKKQQ